MRIAVQLYTLRQALEQDLPGGLKRLGEMGFRSVELASLHGRSPAEWRSMLAKSGLAPCSAHVSMEQAEAPDQLQEVAEELGVRRFVLPYLTEEERASGWKAVAVRLSAIGRAMADRDWEFCYHNHDFELAPAGAGTGLDVLFAESSPTAVQAEPDVFWLKHGGVEPAPWLQGMAARIPLVHFKDRMADGTMTEVGSGELDWEDIIETCRAGGAEYAIIEHDNPSIDCFESVKRSRDFLVSQGLRD